jgi:hypothetical protein
MNVSKMDHAMLSFAYLGNLATPRRKQRREGGLVAWLFRKLKAG